MHAHGELALAEASALAQCADGCGNLQMSAAWFRDGGRGRDDWRRFWLRFLV
jgi:hypothetical protein